MSRLREFLRWAWAIIAAAAALLLGVFAYGRRRAREGVSIGEAKQRATGDRERLREAAETGDDEAVLREWRRHRK